MVKKYYIYCGLMLLVAGSIVFSIAYDDQFEYLKLVQFSLTTILCGLTLLIIVAKTNFEKVPANIYIETFWIPILLLIFSALCLEFISSDKKLLSPLLMNNVFLFALFPIAYFALLLNRKFTGTSKDISDQ